MRCPNCGEENPEGARFCLECATALSPGRSAAGEERKVVSVLFCDLVGFTAASEEADPEDVRARLSAYNSMLRTEIERFGGTVEKFIGDAVMAVFGAPSAHEDDAERAVRSGLRILEAITELNETQPGLDLQVRVGINTGEALVSLGVRPDSGEGFVTGDVVNTASRLQGVAPVGGVAVSQPTYEQTSAIFDYEELPPTELKGKTHRVRLFHALSAKARFGTEVTRRHTTPLVGRQVDLALLTAAFDKAASSSAVQLITIVGEPGVGKSRLVAEMFTNLDARREVTTWRQGRCIPYGDGATFWALSEIVKAECGILDSDDPDVARGKLEQTLRRLIEDPRELDWFAERISPLLGLASAAASREETFTAWRRLLEAIAASNPLVCVIEDLHWADEAMLSFVEHLAEWSSGVSMLVVATARPELFEKHPTWGSGLRHGQVISLDPLPESDCGRLILLLLGRTVLPAETQMLLVERSGGNPLYAEEYVRMLSDRGLVDEAGSLLVDPDGLPFPESISAIIAARLDTLAPERKAVLQDASVVGKVFWPAAVAALGRREQHDVELALHELSKKELVRRSRTSSVAEQPEYTFWHAFVRDVAYSQIPRAARATKHQATAVWIQELAGERTPEYAEVLAHHYLQALELTGRDLQSEVADGARRHLLLAASRAEYLDISRSEALARKALEITPERSDAWPECAVGLARALMLLGQMDDAAALYEKSIERFKASGDEVRAASSLAALADIVFETDPDEGRKLLDHAITTLRRHPPGPELVTALFLETGCNLVASRYEDVVEVAMEALALIRSGVTPERSDHEAGLLGYVGEAHFYLGETRGRDEVRAALQMLRGQNSSVALTWYAQMQRRSEDLEDALESVRQAVWVAESVGATRVRFLVTAVLIDFLFESGAWDEAIERGARGMRDLEAIGDPQTGDRYERERLFGFLKPAVARILSYTGELAQAADLIKDVIDNARGTREQELLAYVLSVAAVHAELARDRARARALVAEIAQVYDGAADEDRLDYAHDLVRIAVDAGDPDLGARLIDRATPHWPRSKSSLASARAALAMANGQHAEAQRLYREAIDGWGHNGYVLQEGYSWHGLGHALAATHDETGSAEALRRAEKIFEGLGAVILLERPPEALADRAR